MLPAQNNSNLEKQYTMASAATTLFVLSAIPLAAGSYWFTGKLLARLRHTQDTSKLHAVCFFLLFFAMSTLFVLGSLSTLMRAYNLSTKPVYDAVITGYSSEWHESQSTDPNRRIGTQELMYTAQLSFKDSNGQQVHIANSVQSNSIPVVGEHINVVYEPGDEKAEEKSWRSVLLLIVSSVLLLLLGFALYGCIAFARNQNMRQFMQASGALFAKVVVPAGVVTLLVLLLCAMF